MGEEFPINGFVGGYVVLNDGAMYPIEPRTSANPATEEVTGKDEGIAQGAARETLRMRGLLGRAEGAQVAIQKKSILPWHGWSSATRSYGSILFGQAPTGPRRSVEERPNTRVAAAPPV